MLDRDVASAPATAQLPVPDYRRSELVVAPPGSGPGYWAGSPSVATGPDGLIYLAYRLRRPVGAGRGYANVVARSVDGVHFETCCTLAREQFDCDSLERPAIVCLPDGGWRLYVSCATPGSKHWRVDAVDAATPGEFDPKRRVTVLPGNSSIGVKDPVVVIDAGRFHLWLCAHPLDIVGAEDRMWTLYGSSDDGLDFALGDTVLRPRPGRWDARGTRVAGVVISEGCAHAYYDGRATAEANAEEFTGTASGAIDGALTPELGPITAAGGGSGSLRYVSLLDVDGGARLYYETTRLDGAHDLRTEYVPRPFGANQSE